MLSLAFDFGLLEVSAEVVNKFQFLVEGERRRRHDVLDHPLVVFDALHQVPGWSCTRLLRNRLIPPVDLGDIVGVNVCLHCAIAMLRNM